MSVYDELVFMSEYVKPEIPQSITLFNHITVDDVAHYKVMSLPVTQFCS